MKNDYIIIGKIGAAYGIRGWLKIQAYTESKANILQYQPWYIRRNEEWEKCQIEAGRVYKDGIIAKFTSINSPEEAKRLTGTEIAITKSQLPALKQNEYYWSDLIGLTVINQKAEILGKVAYLIPTGSNDVLVVKGEKEHAIPYLLGTVITNIDLIKKEIYVDWEHL